LEHGQLGTVVGPGRNGAFNARRLYRAYMGWGLSEMPVSDNQLVNQSISQSVNQSVVAFSRPVLR